MFADELMQALANLPRSDTEHTAVPQPLTAYLSRPQRIASARLSLPWIEYRLLAALGLSGWSLRYGLVQAEAAWHRQHPRNGAFNRASVHLRRSGLWQVRTVRLTTSVALVRLTALGRGLLAEIGLTPVESEWDKLERKHRGGAKQRQHSAAVCVFAHHARIRCYRVSLCPETEVAEPDLVIEREGKQVFVEVQGRGGEPWRRAIKWQNVFRLQGEVAIYAITPDQAQRYAHEAQVVGVSRGRITDLHTLFRSEPHGLWTHRWQSRYGSLIPLTKNSDRGAEAS